VIAGGLEDTSAHERLRSSVVIAGRPEDTSAREQVQASAREPVQSSARIGGRADEDMSAREQVQWSALYAEDSGLMVPEPWRPLRDGLRRELELADLPRLAADRCWAQARTAWADGRLASVEEAIAATWPCRGGEFPQLIQMVGPSGSGKSRLTARLNNIATVVSMDDLREENASRADQRSNPEILTAALAKLGSALRTTPPGARVIWDATGLNRPQRSLVLRAAQAADAYVTQAVFLVDESALRARNVARPHPIPLNVLTSQINRYQPPYPAEAHRTWYLGGDGTVADSDGEL
jgi:predicted kinase